MDGWTGRWCPVTSTALFTVPLSLFVINYSHAISSPVSHTLSISAPVLSPTHTQMSRHVCTHTPVQCSWTHTHTCRLHTHTIPQHTHPISTPQHQHQTRSTVPVVWSAPLPVAYQGLRAVESRTVIWATRPGPASCYPCMAGLPRPDDSFTP